MEKGTFEEGKQVSIGRRTRLNDDGDGMGDGDAVAHVGASPRFSFNWKTLPIEDLIRYRDEITQVLPPTTLSEINLEEEMLLQFHTVRQVQTRVLDNVEVPANQLAQVANSVASTLNRIVEMQEAVYNSERFKAIENLLIRTLSKLPEELAEQFLVEYAKILENSVSVRVGN